MPSQSAPAIADLCTALREFAAERDWEQFHAPKNLAIALSIEASELLEHFQWIPEARSSVLAADKRANVEEEVADVFLYLIQLADKLGIDLITAANTKLAVNALKYPVDKARGTSRKHTDL